MTTVQHNDSPRVRAAKVAAMTGLPVQWVENDEARIERENLEFWIRAGGLVARGCVMSFLLLSVIANWWPDYSGAWVAIALVGGFVHSILTDVLCQWIKNRKSRKPKTAP